MGSFDAASGRCDFVDRLYGAATRARRRCREDEAVIQPTSKDLGRKVRYREYREDERYQIGHWLEGHLRGIDKFFVVVEFENSIRELNRSTLEWLSA